MSNNQRIVITNYYKSPWSLIEVQFHPMKSIERRVTSIYRIVQFKRLYARVAHCDKNTILTIDIIQISKSNRCQNPKYEATNQ